MGSIVRPVVMRDRGEAHRPSTPLELLFDLCFVVAVAVLAAELHHGLTGNHVAAGVIGYVALFIPVWWAWMSYTWFATAFDNDDVLFRVLTLAQMAGVLALAASIPSAVAGNPVPFTLAFTAMRIPLVLQWLRAARDDRAHRSFALRYVIGIVVAQIAWLSALAVPAPARWAVWAIALLLELLTPMWATRRAPGRVFHAGHIAERYGLFTIIVLGESILAVAVGLRDVIDRGGLDVGIVLVCCSALVMCFAIWWLYFDTLGRQALERHRRAAFIWGYGHAVLFAAIAAIGADVQAQLDVPDAGWSGWGVGIPAALVLASIAWLQASANIQRAPAVRLLAAAGVVLLITAVTPGRSALTDVAIATVFVLAVAVEVVLRPSPTPTPPTHSSGTSSGTTEGRTA